MKRLLQGRASPAMIANLKRRIETMSNESHASGTLPRYSAKRNLHRANFFCRAPEAVPVSLVGDSNNWEPNATPMIRQPDGRWMASLEPSHGYHQDVSLVARPVIRIFAIYEHNLNRDRVGLLQEELTRRLGRSFKFLFSWWELESLLHPQMLKVATDHIAEADIMLFSLVSGGGLPQTLTKWIEREFLDNTARRVSLLALVETGGVMVTRLSPAEIYLSSLSEKAGVDCLCYSDSIPLARAIRHGRQRTRSRKIRNTM
jgi:hypothetical protein